MGQINVTLKHCFPKILIVDDNETDRYIVKRIVEKNEISPSMIPFESGVKALDYLQQMIDNPPDVPELILLDIRMPQMSGFEFLAEFSLLPQSLVSKYRIIMLSSSIDPSDLNKVKAFPFVTGFISKPFEKDKFEKFLPELLNVKE